MNRKAIIVSIALSLAIGTFAGTSFGVVRASTGGCPAESARRVDPASAVADGHGLAAVVGRSIVMIGDDGRRQAFHAPSLPDTVVRHVAASAGHGTAYVEDRRGPDVVVIVDGGGVTRLPQDSEATQPAWSAEGRLVWSVGSGLRLWSGAGRATVSIPAPADTAGIFSPVFTGPDEITAVVSERVPGTRPEDEALNDLFSYDLATGAWTRRTSFQAHGDRWSAIRTPVVGADGALQFVRIVGDAAATVRPTSSLWTIGPGRTPATKIRDLTSEMYLAGVVRGRRVWNVFDRSVGDWRLEAESAGGKLADLGCGRMMVDPLAEDDPDREPPRHVGQDPTATPTPTDTPTPSPTDTPTVTATATPTSSATPSPAAVPVPVAAILVGDFASTDQASAAAAQIAVAYGADAARIIDSTIAPAVVRPGVWAVVMAIPTGQDPELALQAFRGRLPQFADESWVVSL